MRLKVTPLFIFSIIVIFLIFFIAPLDSDLGWHLRYGEHFFKTGQFLKNNTLTYYLPGYFWQNSYTFYQIFTYFINKFLGFFGLTFIHSILFVISFLIFNRINPKIPKLNLITFLTAIFFGWNVFKYGLRAQEFSFIFLTIIFWVISKFEKIINNKVIFVAAPLLFILWVNVHGGYIFGLFFLGLYSLNLLINREIKLSIKLFFLTLICILATFINPYFVGIYQETIKHIFYPLPKLIAEWVAPSMWHQIIIIVSSFIGIFSFASSKSKEKFFWIISIFTVSYISIKSRRNLPIYSLTLILGMINLLNQKLESLEKSKLIEKIIIGIFLIFIPLTLLTTIPKTFSFNLRWDYYCEFGMLPYPCKAVEFIKNHNIKGENVFSSYEWGGFLEWQMPEYKFFVDGRTPAWFTPDGKSPYMVYLEIIQSQPGYQERLEKYGTDWLLIGAGTFLDIELQNNKIAPWQEIYRDNISVIYFPR